MSKEKRFEQIEQDEQEKQPRLKLRNVFYHNTFVLVFSFIVALFAWYMTALNDTETNSYINDVPIEIKLSAAAEEEGLRIFRMSYDSADLEIAGSNLITNKLTSDDFEVSVTLNPTSVKLTGNTMQKMTLPLRAVKRSSISDYTIVSIKPEEVNVEYDRYKESSFPLENEVTYSTDAGFVSGTVTFSEEAVVVSGPESSVNKIARAVVSYSADSPLKADTELNCKIRLLGQDGKEIADTAGLYLELSTDSVNVSIPVMAKKTVAIKATTLNQPKGFSDSRITVEPAQIDVAGSDEALSALNEITLDTAINFADLEIGQKNAFTFDIPLPSGVRDLAQSEPGAVSQATVTINLNGFRQVSLLAPANNFQVLNLPLGIEYTLDTQSLNVTLIGSQAQTAKLTGDSLLVQLDLTNYVDHIGTVDVPATVSLSGSGADSCWVLGKYTVSLTLTEENTSEGVMLNMSSGALNAAPAE